MKNRDEEYARKMEDVAFNATANLLRTIEAGKKLAARVEKPWSPANDKRSRTRELKKAEAKRLRADGQTIPQIVKAIGRSRRTVETYLAED